MLRRYLILAFSVALIALGGLLGYRYFWVTELPEPSPPSDQKPAESAPDEIKVILPGDLEQKIEEDRNLQQKFYANAVEAHTDGLFERAVENYRRAIAHSGRDEIAANSYRYLGDIYSRNTKFQQAARLYRYALNVQPDNDLFHYRLASTYKNLQDFDSAADHFQKAINQAPRSLYYLGLGNLYFQQGQYSKAAESYESGRKQGEYLDRLSVNLGLVRQKLENNNGALSAYKSALNQNLSSQLRYLVLLNRGELFQKKNEFKKAVNSLERAQKIKNTHEVSFNLGLARMENNNYPEAIEAFASALDRKPNDISSLKNLGYIHEKRENYSKSINYYDKAIDLRPQNNDLYMAIGRVFEKNNQPEEALDAYRKLTRRLDQGEGLGQVLRRVGELYLKVGNPENAAPAFRNVLRMNERDHEAHYNLAIAYRRAGNLDRAVDHLQRAIEYNPDSIQYRISLADTQYRAGFKKESRKTYNEIKKRDPSRKDARYMVAYLNYSFGNMSRARKQFQALLPEIDSSELKAKVYQGLGNIYIKNSDHSRAKVAYRKALKKLKEPQLYFNHGLASVYQGQWDIALSSFRKALEMNSENPRYRSALGLALYQRGLYCESKAQLEQALAEDSDNLRAQYDLKKVREALQQEGKTCDVGNRA